MASTCVQTALAITRGETDEPVTLAHLCALAEALSQADRELAEAHIKEVLAGTALAVLLTRLNGGRVFTFKEVPEKNQEVVIQRKWEGRISSVEVRLDSPKGDTQEQ